MANLIESIKKAALEAVKNGGPVSILFGEVKSILPLEVQIEQKMILTKEFLTLTKNVSSYETEITLKDNNEKKKIIIHNELKKNDRVILLQEQGGQKFIVLDKV